MRRFLVVSALGALLATAAAYGSGCTLISNFSECSADADCAAKYGPRSSCSDSLCVLPSTLLGATCQRTMGSVDSPNSLVIGVLLPLTGAEAGFGIPLLNAIELAYGNFEKIGGVGDRSLGLLICDTEGVDDVALEAGRHAVEVARVGAIIGPDFSSQTIDIATQVAIPNDVLLVTPAGTASTISGLDDKNLVWRTAPSDNVQGDAMAQLVEHHITNVLGESTATAVVWLLTREGDAYGDGLQQRLITAFPSDLTGSTNFHPSVYPDDWGDSWFSGTAAELPPPDVVLIMGAAEAWDIAEAIDDAFQNNDPVYFFGDAARNPDEAAKTNSALEGRVLGTAPQAVGDLSYVPYTNFRVKYQAEFDEDPNDLQFVANAYDALHVVAFASAGGQGVTGPALAIGMAKLSAGAPISATSEDAQQGIRLLSQGETIDFQGASGRLDFDENGDPSPSTIVLWCFADKAVPEAGDLLSTSGEFTPLDCAGATNNVANNTTPDMGSSGLGTTDVGVVDQ